MPTLSTARTTGNTANEHVSDHNVLHNAVTAMPTADDHGFLAWTYDPIVALNNSQPTAGVVFYQRVEVATAGTITNVVLYVVTAGSGLANCFAGLLNSSGVLLSATADQSTPWGSTGTKVMALSAPQAVAAGTYYVAFLVGSGTRPAFARSAGTGVVNANLSAPSLRFGSIGTGLTAIPGTNDLATGVSSGVGYWAGVS